MRQACRKVISNLTQRKQINILYFSMVTLHMLTAAQISQGMRGYFASATERVVARRTPLIPSKFCVY